MAGDLNDRVRQVREHRLANRTIYPNAESLDAGAIRQEIIEYMCHRRPELCIEGLKAAIPNPAKTVVDATCPKCGSKDVTPNYCKTCGGNRVESYTCNACKSKF